MKGWNMDLDRAWRRRSRVSWAGWGLKTLKAAWRLTLRMGGCLDIRGRSFSSSRVDVGISAVVLGNLFTEVKSESSAL